MEYINTQMGGLNLNNPASLIRIDNNQQQDTLDNRSQMINMMTYNDEYIQIDECVESSDATVAATKSDSNKAIEKLEIDVNTHRARLPSAQELDAEFGYEVCELNEDYLINDDSVEFEEDDSAKSQIAVEPFGKQTSAQQQHQHQFEDNSNHAGGIDKNHFTKESLISLLKAYKCSMNANSIQKRKDDMTFNNCSPGNTSNDYFINYSKHKAASASPNKCNSVHFKQQQNSIDDENENEDNEELEEEEDDVDLAIKFNKFQTILEQMTASKQQQAEIDNLASDEDLDQMNKVLHELGKKLAHGNHRGGSQENLSNLKMSGSEEDDLPKHLIVASIPSEVFANSDCKNIFEKLFLDIDNKCQFCYFRIFKRCCVKYEDGISALLARFQLDDQLFLNDRLRIFLTKVRLVI
jgi:hypothetical protein